MNGTPGSHGRPGSARLARSANGVSKGNLGPTSGPPGPLDPLFKIVESKPKTVRSRRHFWKFIPAVLFDRTKSLPAPFAVRRKDIPLPGKIPVAPHVSRSVAGGKKTPGMGPRKPVQIVPESLQLRREGEIFPSEACGILQHAKSLPGAIETGIENPV